MPIGELKAKSHYSYEEYLELERDTDLRYELENGQVFAMAGSSMNHNLIANNIMLELRSQSKQQGEKCAPFTSDLRVQIYPKGIYFYPDVVFTCDERDLQDGKSISHPALIVEVLCPSTAERDLHTKLFHYLNLPSLLYYLVLEQSQPTAYLYSRTGNGWLLNIYARQEEVLPFPALAMQISLGDVYADITFDLQP